MGYCDNRIKGDNMIVKYKLRLLVIVWAFTLILTAAGKDIPVAYTVKTPGNVSAAIYNSKGNLVRELLRGKPTAAGTHLLKWDGLDRDGLPQPPGNYTWKLLHTPGFEAKYLGMVGINVVEQPYDPWVGNNDGPSAVAWDETGWYVGSIASETIPTYRKQSPDGSKRLWQKDPLEAWQGPKAMTSTNGTIFILQQNGKVIPIVAATGAHKTYGDDIGKIRPAGWDVLAPGDNRNGSGGSTSGGMDMDAHAEEFVVSYENFNLVRWYSTKPLIIPNRTSATSLKELSDIQILRTEQITAPKGVACGVNGVTYVISKGAVLAIDKETKTFISAEQIENPCQLAFCHKTGDLLIAEGAPANQIKRFGKDGKLIAIYGRKGGRADGPFVAGDFRGIRDIAATDDGGFLICEDTVRRTALFDNTGKVIGQWFGGSPYFNFASISSEKPDEIWFLSSYSALGAAKMDFEHGTWELTASYSISAFGDGLFPTHSPHFQWHVSQRNGVTYLINDSSAILRLDLKKQMLMPFAIVGTVDKKKPPKPWSDAVESQKMDLKKLTGAYCWTDINLDGEFQPEEFRLEGKLQRGYEGHCFIDEKWNLYFGIDGSSSPWVCLPDQSAKEAKVPVWDWSKAESANAKWPAEIAAAGGAEVRGILRDEAGATYQFIAANRNPKADRHGASWPGNRSGTVRLIKWNADGTVAWNVGKHGYLDAWSGAKPGEYNDPSRILGITHGCLVIGDRSGWPASAWTMDGLYAGSFLDRRADDGLPARIYSYWREKRPLAADSSRYEPPSSMHPDTPIPWDCLAGGSIMTSAKGEVLWLPQGENATPVYRVSGWNDINRQEGKIELATNPPHAEGTGTGLSAEYTGNNKLEENDPAYTRVDSQIWFGQKTGPNKWDQWSKLIVPGIDEINFSAKWSGFLEPQFSEEYIFSVYISPKDKIRLWIDNQLVIDDWVPAVSVRQRPKQTYESCDEVASKPISLNAGTRVPIRLEYANEGPASASLSLNWDSNTRERQRIPTAYLYPVDNK